MEVIHTLSPALYFAAAVICFVTGGIMIFYSCLRQKSDIYLGLSFLTIASIHFTLYLFVSRLIAAHAPLFRSTEIVALLYMPFSYLSVRATFTGKKERAVNWLHFLPAFICIVDLVPAMTFPEIKNGWLLPTGFIIPARIVLIFGYWILQARLARKRIVSFQELYKPAKGLQRWIIIYLALQLAFFLPAIALLPNLHEAGAFRLLYFFSAAGAVFMAISVLMYPRLVYEIDSITEELNAAIKTKSLPDSEWVAQTSIRLSQYLQDHRPFLKQGYTIKELAAGMDMPLHLFSAFINQSLGKNFNDLMNHYRILYSLELVQGGESKKLNLHGLALKCGFSNRNTFTIAFKKSTGLTPSKYLELIHGYRPKLKPGPRKKTKKRRHNSK